MINTHLFNLSRYQFCSLFNINIINRNIFLTNDDHIRLGDLGISRIFDDEDTNTSSFISTYAGTHYYMSPEIINRKRYSYNTDIW
jgi:serine/threonine protein kinase